MPEDLPLHVADAETILRGIVHPYHTKRRGAVYELKHNALRPPAGRDDLSVMRLDYMGFPECRRRASGLQGYIGVARLSVAVVREHGSDVLDSREEFWGHAHIEHGVMLQKDEPPDAAALQALTDRLKKMIGRARFDLDPGGEVNWELPPLT